MKTLRRVSSVESQIGDKGKTENALGTFGGTRFSISLCSPLSHLSKPQTYPCHLNTRSREDVMLLTVFRFPCPRTSCCPSPADRAAVKRVLATNSSKKYLRTPGAPP